jgi:alpha-glucosidase
MKEGALIKTQTVSTIQKSGVIFEIYPKSFKAGNGGSQGDLKGIIQKLDYLAWLGVQQLWLPPIYPSPMKDGGYDVSNYYGIDPSFGTLRDFDRLVKAAEKRGIGIIMDIVVNHTSEEHEWFKEALRSKKSPFRDRYIFRQAGADGGVPNNLLSVFGGSAWEPVPNEAGTYYYHTFAREQPDLNYDNPAVSAEVERVVRFWFDRGVKGARVDAVHFIGKETDRDEPKNPDWDGQNSYLALDHPYTHFQPGMFTLLNRLCEVAASYSDRFVVFEATPLDGTEVEIYHRLYKALNRSVSAPFHFGILFVDWRADLIKQHVEDFLGGLPEDAVPVWNVSNHDQPRVASRIGEGQARVAMALILTLPGVPTLYYGDEIGMVNGDVGKVVDDPRTNDFSRDVVRTPMQWDDSDTGGFTRGETKPWLKLNPDYKTRNVATEKKDPASILNFTRLLISLRRRHPILELGRYVRMDSGTEGVLAFGRRLDDALVTVILNFTDQEKTVRLPEKTQKLMFSMRKQLDLGSGRIDLHPNEVILLKN